MQRTSGSLLAGILVVVAIVAMLAAACEDGSGPPNGSDPTPAPERGFEVAFIDVGQGDATLITVDGERLLIDGGRSQSRIEERLQAMGVDSIDAIASTHPDADHIAGLVRVLELYEVGEIYLNGGDSDSDIYADLEAAVDAEGATVASPARGDTISLGELELEVLHPDELTGDANGDSLVLRLTCGSVDVLFMGDATVESEAAILGAGLVTDVDVLKVGHHGSDTSTGQELLDAASPEFAVISAGQESQFGHPHDEVVERLEAIAAELYHTDTSGGSDTVTMSSDCEQVTFDGPAYLHEAESPEPDGDARQEPTDTPNSCIDLNQASHEALQEITHIGPDRASEIISLRPVSTLDELEQVSGIGGERIEEIRAQGLVCE